MTYEEAARIMMSGGDAVAKTITKNGAYTVTEEEQAAGYVGYNPVYVSVAPNLTTVSIAENGEYGPPPGYDGYSKVTVNVPSEIANIIPLTVTEPGVYNAADYGCDGFDPVNVSDMYKKLYEQSIGNGEDVTDDNGNNIPNAVTSDDTDDLNEYYKHVEFGPYGGSVTTQGLDGDTSFKFEAYIHKFIYSGGEVRYSTSAKMTVTNLITGQTNISTTNGIGTASNLAPPHRIRITEVIRNSYGWFTVNFQWLDGTTGGVLSGGYRDAKVSFVGGTCFVQSKSYASTVSQKSEPDAITDYT